MTNRLIGVSLTYMLTLMVIALGFVFVTGVTGHLAIPMGPSLVLFVWIAAWVVHVVMSAAWIADVQLHRAWPIAGILLGIASFGFTVLPNGSSQDWQGGLVLMSIQLLLFSPWVWLGVKLVHFHLKARVDTNEATLNASA